MLRRLRSIRSATITNEESPALPIATTLRPAAIAPLIYTGLNNYLYHFGGSGL